MRKVLGIKSWACILPEDYCSDSTKKQGHKQMLMNADSCHLKWSKRDFIKDVSDASFIVLPVNVKYENCGKQSQSRETIQVQSMSICRMFVCVNVQGKVILIITLYIPLWWYHWFCYIHWSLSIPHQLHCQHTNLLLCTFYGQNLKFSMKAIKRSVVWLVVLWHPTPLCVAWVKKWIYCGQVASEVTPGGTFCLQHCHPSQVGGQCSVS